jgi:hypothetical protein
MGYIMTNEQKNIRFSRGKVYLSFIMAGLMGLIEVLMHDSHYHTFSTQYYIILGSVVVLFVYLYRNQVGIDDINFLNEMIEHHSMALLTTNKILEKTSDYKTKRIAMQIRNIQELDINDMNDILGEKNEKKNNRLL